MKVLNLQCEHQHVFEGWFASEDDFQSQLQRQLVQCPMCGSAAVTKRLSAPRLNLGASPKTEPDRTSAPSEERAADAGANERAVALQALWLEMARHVVANTEDVGKQFADQARRMHAGELPERAIRGQATPEERSALLEDGVPIMMLPLPEVTKGPVH